MTDPRDVALGAALLAAIREAVRPQPDLPSVSETDARQKLLLEAQREIYRRELEALHRDATP